MDAFNICMPDRHWVPTREIFQEEDVMQASMAPRRALPCLLSCKPATGGWLSAQVTKVQKQ